MKTTEHCGECEHLLGENINGWGHCYKVAQLRHCSQESCAWIKKAQNQQAKEV
jgi:hypothetical protein